MILPILFCDFLTGLAVEITGNKFENQKREQAHPNFLRKESTRDILSESDFLGYNVLTNVSGFERYGLIIYLWLFCIGFVLLLSVNGKTNPISGHAGLATSPESFAQV